MMLSRARPPFQSSPRSEGRVPRWCPALECREAPVDCVHLPFGGGAHLMSCSIQTKLQEHLARVFDLADCLGTESLQRSKVPSGRRQQKRHSGDAFVRLGELECLPCDSQSQAEVGGLQHQTEVPFVSFLLKTAPANVASVGEDPPMTEAVSLPTRFLSSNEGRTNFARVSEASPRNAWAEQGCERLDGVDAPPARVESSSNWVAGGQRLFASRGQQLQTGVSSGVAVRLAAS